MRRRKRRFTFFSLSILSLGALAYLIFFYPPSRQFSILPALPAGRNFQFSITVLLFLLFFLFTFSLVGLLTNHTLRAVTYATVTCLYLYLRLINLTHPFFLVLLAALLIILELLFRRNK